MVFKLMRPPPPTMSVFPYHAAANRKMFLDLGRVHVRAQCLEHQIYEVFPVDQFNQQPFAHIVILSLRVKRLIQQRKHIFTYSFLLFKS